MSNPPHPAGQRPRRPTRRSRPTPAQLVAAVPAGVIAAAALGVLLLVVAEFTTLYTIHTAAYRSATATVGTGGHDSYALLPMAGLIGFLSVGVWRTGSRLALAAVGVLGIAALLFALARDLPDAQAGGVIRLAGHFQLASASPSAGLYLETLGAIVLIIAAATGLLLTRPAA